VLFPWHPELVPKSRDFGYKTELMAGKKLGAGLEIGLCVGFRPTDLRGCVLGRTTDRPPGGVRASCSLVGERFRQAMEDERMNAGLDFIAHLKM
jgi:hypothetical protein